MAAAVACLAVVAGPAAAAPRAIDFERVLTRGGGTPGGAVARASQGVRVVAAIRTLAAAASRGGGGGDGARMLELRSRTAFDLVGFRWRGRDVPQLSVSSYGARGWSRWTPVRTDSEDRPDTAGSLTGERVTATGSEPVWTGRSTRLRVRLSGNGFHGLRAHFVKLSRSARIPVARTAGSGGVAPVESAPPKNPGGGSSAPVGRGAAVPVAPPVVTRAQWGGDSGCKPRAKAVYGEVLVTLVHHTVSTNSYSAAEAPNVVLGICRYHRNSNKWNDIGYNLVIDRFGTIYEGRAGGVDKAVIGAHAQGYNGQTAGIALVGTFTGVAPPTATIDSLRTVLKWKLALAGITRNERAALISTGGALNRFKYGRTIFMRPISGHRDVGATSCPGNGLYSLLPGLAGFLDQSSRIATRMTMRQRRAAGSGDSQAVLVSGRLRAGGQGLANELIEIQSFTANGWVKIAETRSDASGAWQASIQPRLRSFVRGAFTGSGSHRPVRSIWRFTPKIKLPPASGPTSA